MNKEKLLNSIKNTFKSILNSIISFFKTNTGKGLLNSIYSIGFGLFVGFLIMFIVKPSKAFSGFADLLTGGLAFGSATFGNVLLLAAPLILVGLSVAFAFKTGLFNIGASGQFMVAGITALYVAHLVTLPSPIHFIVASLAAIIAGAIWAAIPGLLKAYFNVSEVISTIMFNYIGMYTAVILAKNPLISVNSRVKTYFPTANTPSLGFNKIFSGSNLDMSILIAVLVAIFIWFILQRTTLGFQLKAVGYSNEGSKYAGINYKRNIIVSMIIAGALSGLAAAVNYLAANPDEFAAETRINQIGFEGISVALIAQNNPIGIIFSGTFLSYIKKGAIGIQLAGYTKEISSIVMSVIIYTIAISGFIGLFFQNKKFKNLVRRNKKAGDE